MTHTALIVEVFSQISRQFSPKIAEIKSAIEILLEKEYMIRVEGQHNVSAIRLPLDFVLCIDSTDL